MQILEKFQIDSYIFFLHGKKYKNSYMIISNSTTANVVSNIDQLLDHFGSDKVWMCTR